MPTSSAKRSNATANPAPTVHQFRIVLDGAEPPIWRSIQLPSQASFWDLHCAITDAMGWDDSHLHEFRIGRLRDGVRIRVPMDDGSGWFDDTGLAGWKVPIATHFGAPGARCVYVYDFGDDWSHQVRLEAILPHEAGMQYPRCVAGARACPPEDCGGFYGYERLCAALAHPDPRDEEAEELLEWLGDDFDPEAFDAGQVKFGSAARRLKALRGSMR